MQICLNRDGVTVPARLAGPPRPRPRCGRPAGGIALPAA